ncbi:MAG: PHP domain-containing protein, partial [Pseudomonadota bacterium]|nr:PHP domain-containing protein [Pseudomonadota bacterium]
MSVLPSPDDFRPEPVRYAELAVTSNFSFLRGASHPEELVTRAAMLNLDAVAITDRNSLAGVVRAYSALKEIKRAAAEEGVQIRSHSQIDTSSRKETNTSPPLPAPQTLKLPRLIVGARLCLQDSPLHWVALPTDR